MKKILSCVVATSIFLSSCATTMQEGTSSRLAPELTKDDTEIYVIFSGGNGFTSMSEVKRNAKQRACIEALRNGYDGYLLLDSQSDIKTYAYTSYETKQATTHSYSDVSAYGCNNYGTCTNVKGSAYGTSTTSYEVPVTKYVNKGAAKFYVIFKNENQLDYLKNTKWRNNVVYAESELEQIESEIASETAINVILGVLSVAVLIGVGLKAE